MWQVAIGIDIGGTNTAIGVVDREGNVLYEKKPQLATPQKRENPNMTEVISVELTEKYIASLTAEIRTAIDTVKHINPEIEILQDRHIIINIREIKGFQSARHFILHHSDSAAGIDYKDRNLLDHNWFFFIGNMMKEILDAGCWIPDV